MWYIKKKNWHFFFVNVQFQENTFVNRKIGNTRNYCKIKTNRPILCANGPNIFVPIRYDTLAGRKATPRSNELACQDSIIHNGNDGSSIAIPRFPIVIDPKNYQKTLHKITERI